MLRIPCPLRAPLWGGLATLLVLLPGQLARAQVPAANPTKPAATAGAKPATAALTKPAGPLSSKPVTPGVGGKPVAKAVGKTIKDKVPQPSSKPQVCGPSDAGVILLPGQGNIKCNEHFEECEGTLELVAHNCTTEFLSFTKAEFFESGRRTLVLEFDPAGIGSPNGPWKETIPWSTPTEMEVVVYFKPPGSSGAEMSTRAPAKVVNQALATAQAACTACEGTWGRYGVNKDQGCNCKTKDAGKTCYDGDECEGQCMFVRFDGNREEGKCSDTQRLKGCFGVVMKGQSKLPQREPGMRKMPFCFD